MTTPVKLGSEFLINSTTANDQLRSSITTLADGGFVVTWQSEDQDGDGWGIYGQRYDSLGATVGSEFLINSTTADEQNDPSITALPFGGFVVAWTSDGQDGSFRGVYAQRYDSLGATVGSSGFQVNTYTTDSQSNPSITALNDGSFVITWQSDGQDGAFGGIYGQRYDSLGAIAGPEFRINTQTLGPQSSPSITTLADGGFVVTWESGQVGSSGYGIYGQRYDSLGATVGSEFQVNSYTTDNQLSPSIIALADGGFVVTWRSDGQDGSLWGVYGQRYDSMGASVGSEFRINSHTASAQEHPSITALADGGFVVTWQSYGQDGSVDGVYGQRYDSLGASVGSEFLINSTIAGDQARPSITAMADGGFVVTWQSNNQDGSGYGIYGQRFKAQLFGTSDADAMSDTVGANWMDGQGGNDVLNGKGGADEIFGRGGKDTLKGGSGKDNLKGGNGADIVKGGNGADIVKGGNGNDKLSGNKGNDKLTGNAGKDKFIFNKFDGKDTITDFTDGQDKIDLRAFNFSTKAQALAKFYEIGSATNDKLGFDHKGTTIIVKGIDMSDLNGADIII